MRSACQLWKVTSTLFMFAVGFNHTIAIFYWGVLFPLVKLKHIPYMEEYRDYGLDFTFQSFYNHGLPSALLTLDWVVNDINLEVRMLPFVLALGTVYMLINMTVVLKSG
jgi:hypothetical protein